MNTILAVGIGGGLGAILRHLLNTAVAGWLGTGFPYGIMLINITGSIVMGLLIGLFAHIGDPPQQWRLFLTTGMLGGYTTFSTFSLDSILLIERGAYGLAALYVGLSVGVSLVGLMAGMWGVRLWLT
jgi:CrcB protein